MRNVLLFAFVSVSWAQDKPPGYAVATAHPLATQAGMDILESGGNAFDAAVAISAALSVVEPYSSGIGGGGFWLLHRGSDGFESMLDGREVAPLAATPNMYLNAKGEADPKLSRDGALAAAIPGAPAAWVHLAKKYGTQPLPKLLAPAIRLARDGFPADARLAKMLALFGGRLTPAISPFAPDGKPAIETMLIRQPDKAATLDTLAQQGRAGFYSGPVAQKLVDGVRAAGGIWTLEDLSRYKIIERKPLTFYFRDHRIVSAPPPSAGGIALAQVFAMLEALAWPAAAAPGASAGDLKSFSMTPADGAGAKHLLVEGLRRAYRDRGFLGDPDFVDIPSYRLLSRDYALALAHGIKPGVATPSGTLAVKPDGDNTTHFSVLDQHGNRVAATLSINLPFGSGFIAPGTGVVLNNEMDDFSAAAGASNAYGLTGSNANAIRPGKRPLSSMSPTFVEGPRGLLILGTPGGSRIISMVLLGALGFTQGLDAQGVVSLPRYHHQYLPDQIEYEPKALNVAEQAALNALGHRLKQVPDGYGNMHAVWWDVAGGKLEAASDPRGIGAAAVRPHP